MVKVLFGNILDSKAQTIVNTVNCVGIMGKGIALEFKEQFPDMFSDYVDGAIVTRLGSANLTCSRD